MSEISFGIWQARIAKRHTFSYEDMKGFLIEGFIFIYKKNAYFFWKIIWFLFYSIAEGFPLIIENNMQCNNMQQRCRAMLSWSKFPLHFRTFGALFSQKRHQSSLWVIILTEAHQHKPYLLRNSKEKSLEVLNRMISVTNCNRRFEKSLRLETFHAKDRWFLHLCGTERSLFKN